MATAYESAKTLGNVVFDGDKPEFDREYIVLEADTESDAYSAVAAIAPTEMFGLTRKAERQPLKIKYVGGSMWNVTATYVVSEVNISQDASEERTTFTLDFDTGGETFTRRGVPVAKQRRFSWSEGSDPAPNIKGALGWDGKKASGINMVIPGLKMTLSANYPARLVGANQIKAWSRNTGKVNSDSFLGFAPGELLNLGAKGKVTLDAATLRALGSVPVSFVFQANENIPNGYSEGEIFIESKKGWEHVDVVIGPFEDTTTTPPTVVQKPLYAYVSDPYSTTSFRAMTGIR